ncbi:SigE family RNA polymerase sigma factor [Streptomyces rubradiris]|uniref:RNA polymerase sigma-70 factor, sigma-E family n=1 Tax=Streptomyces rubradiris TaxID=285531 RepID=A0ABQ3REX3_STRRR|nr:SigE family RNA polymerase sigma factor [Streptomyces rubradiris]GHG97560.1 hypothetical protein GCM10018792_09500 [Streptomyces rubradiris]GHI54432.1 hypothetical protein Srubr_42780 [Streptomyces rubradiris]
MKRTAFLTPPEQGDSRSLPEPGTAAPAPDATADDAHAHQREGKPSRPLDLRHMDRDTSIARLFAAHHGTLLRLAYLLGSGDDAEDVVAEAFYQLHRRWGRLRTPEAALGYLRSIVCNVARMRLRHLRVVGRHAQRHVETAELSAEQQVILRDEHRMVVQALRSLPVRQHQVLVLRYWLDLTESQIAQTLGISPGSVKSHASRGMAKLGAIMKGVEA